MPAGFFGSGFFGNPYFAGNLGGGAVAPIPPAVTGVTTGTTSFTPPLVELFEEAFERVGVEMRSGYDFRTARRSLNLLTLEWASRGLNLWTIEQGAIPLVAGTATYNLPLDTIDLIDHVIRQNVGNITSQTDITISRISVSTYSSIPNKLSRGRPIQLYINRQAGVPTPTGTQSPTVTVWPVPATGEYTLVYWRMRRMQDAGSGNNLADIPFRFIPCLVAGLAYQLAMKRPEAEGRLAMLKAEYEYQWTLAAEEDRDRAPVRFVPRSGLYR